MTSLYQRFVQLSPQLLSLLRIVAGLLFVAHGTQKVLGYPLDAEFGGFELFTADGFTGLIETFGGLAVLLGLFTRPVAIILAGETAIIYLTTFASVGPWPRTNGGDIVFFYCFLFLYLAAAGGGPWSLDGWLRGKAKPPTDYLARWKPQLCSVLRIVTTFLFFTHGTEDVFGWPWDPAAEPFTEPLISGLQGFGHILEVIGGPILLLGLWTRPLAFMFSGEMAVAYFYSHQPRTFWPILNAGEDAVFFCFTFLYLAAVGGGPWALDRLRRGTKAVSE